MSSKHSLKTNLYEQNIWKKSLPRKKSNNVSTKISLKQLYQGSSEETFCKQKNTSLPKSLFRDICLPNRIWRKISTKKIPEEKSLPKIWRNIATKQFETLIANKHGKIRTDAICWKNVSKCHQFRFLPVLVKKRLWGFLLKLFLVEISFDILLMDSLGRVFRYCLVEFLFEICLVKISFGNNVSFTYFLVLVLVLLPHQQPLLSQTTCNNHGSFISCQCQWNQMYNAYSNP